MKYISTNRKISPVSARTAVLEGLAADGGLFMPQEIPPFPKGFVNALVDLSLPEIAYEVGQLYLHGDLSKNTMAEIVERAFTFPAPLAPLSTSTHILELFHGPTLAFKDFGARFMAQLMGHFLAGEDRGLTILVATSGDTGSAVAHGFYGVEGIEVVLLYPSGKVSELQEKQFTTLGANITALEVDGTFDDCQRIVKAAFLDPNLKRTHRLGSANSINIARLIPQSFYYVAPLAR